MDKIVIQGGERLKGKVEVSGSKNAALPLMASTILCKGKTELTRVPDLADIRTMSKLLRGLGIEVKEGSHSLKIWSDQIAEAVAPYDLVRTMRASVLVLGPLLARTGFARVSLPGGCAIGARPINRHLKALEQMGAEIKLEGGYVEAKCTK
ncbi:MAG: UDP-N-acetylglucosamine 1-carboxyvinyltransferase, partial [Deltaproteobacteria bacterium]|nr:UDP-N-acetylglucosamine 1-carboxyvinyltransferase [Deltaproteobacteria bacterium]